MSATNSTVPCPEGDVNGPYGMCSAENYRILQAKVDATHLDIKTCCNASQDCATLLNKIALNQHAAEARADMNDLCFSGGDDGHREAMTNALTAMQKCQDCYDQKCRPTPVVPPLKAAPLDDEKAMAEKSAATGLTGSALAMHSLA